MIENQEIIRKVKGFLRKKIVEQKGLEKEWENFRKKETYLTYEERKYFFDKIKKIKKYPWYYALNVLIFSKLKKQKIDLRELKIIIKDYNDQFITTRLREYSSFFEGKDDSLKFPLDQDQRISVIKDDKHNLVVAGAGSGKTSVITNRIAYLVRRKDKIENDKILALAFTRVAANEMKERLKKNFKVDVSISTFHSLGFQIIREGTDKKPNLLFDGSEYDQNQLINDIFKTLLSTKKYQNNIINYFSYHLDEDIKEETFEDKEDFYRYLRNKNYTTLNNIQVKSTAERDIANFLFRNGINFLYEPIANWIDEKTEDKEYRPDFHLPDYDIYIEHWGLDENMQVPPWFSKSSQEYRNLRNWKLTQFIKYQKTLIETWDYEHRDGVLLYNLKQSLLKVNANIKFVPKSYEELVENVHEFKEKTEEFSDLIASFIRIAKSNFLFVKDIAKNIRSDKYSRKQKLFGKIALDVYKRYQKILKIENKIDFNDMINTAVEFVVKNPNRYLNRYDHVLVDEFQDISYQRLQLIKGFVNECSKTKLFCVGDDWQSIFQFTGSDVIFFTNFSEFFAKPEVNILKSNYRCTRRIVEMSNDLISRNKNQIKKVVYSKNKPGYNPLLFEFSEKSNYKEKSHKSKIFSLIEKLLSEGEKSEEIMVISRFNKNLYDVKIHCGANGIPIEEEVEGVVKKKGVRFYSVHKSKGTEAKHVILMGLTSGMYGFPCEIQDSSVFELAQRFEKKSFIEEERRLFYVALTRAKEFLYLFTTQNINSVFLSEIEPFIIKIDVNSFEAWNQIISEFIPKYIKGIISKSKVPTFCPKCGKPLLKRTGKHGAFLGCTGFPNCKYIFNFIDENTILCPRCGKPMVEDNGSYGKYLKCIAYSECGYKIYYVGENDIPCPSCGGKLVVKVGKYGRFLSCASYPYCDFIFNLERKSKRYIYCPKCRCRLFVKNGKLGKYIGCTNYPNCKFIYEI